LLKLSYTKQSLRYLTLIAAALILAIGQPGYRVLASALPVADYARESSSADLNGKSSPAAPNAKTFKCGDKICDADKSYCEMIKTDVRTIPNVYTCKPLPASCLANKKNELPSCGCFPQGTRCIFCSTLERNGTQYLQRTCIGGGAGNWHLP
jgi:hypothetical protein